MANNQLPYLLFAAGAILAIMILLKRSYRYFGRRSRGGHMTQVARPDSMPNPIDEARGSREFDRWEVRMEQRMREHTAILDSKMIALQELLNEADRTIAKLNDARERANQESDVDREM
ncbi:MAG: hypothetical protein MI757_06150 [Pirellulales bacterium]|nr:hypothetical protein [Pirellulales bacterium]